MNVIINATNLEEPTPHPVRVKMSTVDRIRAIIKETAQTFDAEPSEILAKGKTHRVAQARHIAMWLVRTHTTLSLAEIALAFQRRDHGTIMHACQNVAAWIRQGGERAATINRLSERFSTNRTNAQ